jgi:AcrR family transcriptional regulator
MTDADPGDRKRLPPAERRAELLRAAREVFLEQGFSGARMRAIAERAGVTQPLIYRYFASREELYQAAVQEPFVELLDQLVLDARALGEDPALHGTALKNRVNALFVEAMNQIAPLAAAALYSDINAGKAFYQSDVRPRLRAAVASVYEELTGEEMPDADLGFLAVVTMGPHFGVALDAALRSTEVDSAATGERLTKLLG